MSPMYIVLLTSHFNNIGMFYLEVSQPSNLPFHFLRHGLPRYAKFDVIINLANVSFKLDRRKTIAHFHPEIELPQVLASKRLIYI